MYDMNGVQQRHAEAATIVPLRLPYHYTACAGLPVKTQM
jgi:hypothetical protein